MISGLPRGAKSEVLALIGAGIFFVKQETR